MLSMADYDTAAAHPACRSLNARDAKKLPLPIRIPDSIHYLYLSLDIIHISFVSYKLILKDHHRICQPGQKGRGSNLLFNGFFDESSF